MKKVVILLLVFVLVLGLVSTSLATSFDYNKLQDLEGYKYDKFTKTWSYYEAYVKEYSDARIIIGLRVDGDASTISGPPMMYIKILDNYGKLLYAASNVYYLIGDKLYQFEGLMEADDLAFCFLGTIGQEFISDLSSAAELSVKVEFEYKTITFDITSADLKKTLQLFAKTIVTNDMYSYIDDTSFVMYDLLFNAAVE